MSIEETEKRSRRLEIKIRATIRKYIDSLGEDPINPAFVLVALQMSFISFAEGFYGEKKTLENLESWIDYYKTSRFDEKEVK